MIPGLFSRFIIYTYGTLRPAYLTYNSLCSRQVDDYKAWSKYWIVYALLVCFTAVADVLLILVPLYEEMKLLVVLWVVLAAPHASVWMFDSILHPVYSRRQHQIENLCRICRAKCVGIIMSILARCMFWTQTTVLPTLTMAMREQIGRLCGFLPGVKKFKQIPMIEELQEDELDQQHVQNTPEDKSEQDFSSEDFVDESERDKVEQAEEEEFVQPKCKREKFPVKTKDVSGTKFSVKQEQQQTIIPQNQFLQPDVYTVKDLRRRSSRSSNV